MSRYTRVLALLAAAVFLTACSKDTTVSDAKTPDTAIAASTELPARSLEEYLVYDAEEAIALPFTAIADSSAAEGRLYILGLADEAPSLISCDGIETKALPLTLEKLYDNARLAYGGDCLWLLDGGEASRLDLDGGVLSAFTIDDSDSLVDIAAYDGGLLAAAKNKICLYDLAGNQVFSADAPSGYSIGSLVTLGDGRVACQAYSKYDANSAPLLEIKNQKLVELKALENEDGGLVNSYKLLSGGGEFSAFMPVTMGNDTVSYAIVYGIDAGKGVSYPIFDTAGLNISGKMVDITQNGDSYTVLLSSDDSREVLRLTPTDTTKKLISIARVGENIGDINTAIAAFNAQSREYFVTNRAYNVDDGETRLRMDMLQGNAPDILPLVNVSYETYAKAGLLSDIYGFMDEADRTDLTKSILEALQWYDGCLYQIPISYTLRCGYAPAALAVGGAANWSAGQLDKVLSDNPNATVMPGVSLWQKARYFLSYDIDQFMDYDAMTCRFVSEEFKLYLQRLKTIYDRDEAGAESSVFQVFEFDSLRTYKKFMLMNQDYSLLGLPTDNGNGVYAKTILSYGIISGTGKEAGAWAFIKYLLGDQYQQKTANFPVRWSALQARLDSAKGGFEAVEASALSEADVHNIAAGTATGDVAATVEEAALDGLAEDESELIMSLINRIDRVETAGKDARADIIWDEAVYYFKGEKTVDEVCDIIQNRLQTYLAEQS